jgi:predicted anti-sigma-YlaC factor YlaD
LCKRVREQVSLQLDGELSQLELRMLDAHLARCADCSDYAAEVAQFTHAMRAAPLETLERPIVLRRPGRVAVARLHMGVAAAIALAAVGLASQLSSIDGAGPGTARAGTLYQTRSQLDRELEMIDLVHSGGPDVASGATL